MNLFGSDIILFVSYLILLGSIFQFHDLPVLLVAGLINFGVKNQVLQFPFEVVASDLMSVLFYEFDDIIFYRYLDILEIISYFRSDPFILINLELSQNSYMILCTNTQVFEEGENCASIITTKHLDLFHIIGSYMNLFGSGIKFQEISIMLVATLINFGVKNQVPQFSFEINASDLMSLLFYEFDDIIFCEYLDIFQ